MRPLLTIPEAAGWLGIPESTLRKRVAGRQVPFTRPAGTRHVRFSEQDLAEIVAAGRVPVATAPTRLQVLQRTHPPAGPQTPKPPGGPKTGEKTRRTDAAA